MLFVLFGNGVIAFDNNMHEKWRQSGLAEDGVIVNEIENDNVLVLSCEMDPPGGWVTKKLISLMIRKCNGKIDAI